MRFLVALAIFAIIMVAKIEAEEFSIEIPHEYFDQVVKQLLQTSGQNMAESALNDANEIKLVIPDKTFVSDIDKLMDEIQEQLPEDSKMHLSYHVLEDEEVSDDDIFQNFEVVDDDMFEDDMFEDDMFEDDMYDDDMFEDDMFEDDMFEDDMYDDEEYLADAAYDDSLEDEYSEDEYSEDEYSEDDYAEDDMMEDDFSENENTKENKNLEEDEVTAALKSCMPRMCPRIYLPICASIDGVMQTLASPCEYSNMVRCSAATNARLGRAIPSFRVLGGGPCDEIKEESVLSRKKRVASD